RLRRGGGGGSDRAVRSGRGAAGAARTACWLQAAQACRDDRQPASQYDGKGAEERAARAVSGPFYLRQHGFCSSESGRGRAIPPKGPARISGRGAFWCHFKRAGFFKWALACWPAPGGALAAAAPPALLFQVFGKK